jgi:hypothetical protein
LYELEKWLKNASKASVLEVFSLLEAALVDRIVKRIGNQLLRQVVASCILKLYEFNNRSLNHAYQSFTGCFFSKIESSCKLTALAGFSVLLGRFGYQFIGSMQDTIANLVKLTKEPEGNLKIGALAAFEKLYIGTGGPGRGELDSEILKSISRCASDKLASVRKATSSAIHTILSSSLDCRELDTLFPISLKLSSDVDVEVRFEHATCVGKILYLATIKDYKTSSPAPSRQSSLASAFSRQKMEIQNLADAMRTFSSFLSKATSPVLRASLYHSLFVFLKHSKAQILPEQPNHITEIISWISGNIIATTQDSHQAVSCFLRAITKGLLQDTDERVLELTAEKMFLLLRDSIDETQILNDSQLQVCLGIQSFIFTRLGCAVEHMKVRDSALQPLLAHLAHPSSLIRTHTAQCFRQLARAAPSQISDWLTVLYKFAGVQLAELLQAGDSVEDVLFFSLHGHMVALAAISDTIPDSASGVPSLLIESMFELCQKLFAINCGTFGSPSYMVKHTIKISAWKLVGSIIGLGTEWIGSHLNPLFSAFKNALMAKTFVGTPGEVLCQLQERAHSLVALRTFVAIFQRRMTVSASGEQSAVLKPTIRYVRNTFLALKALSEQKISDPQISAALDEVKYLLLDTFAALPPLSFAAIFVNLLHVAVSTLTTNNPSAAFSIFHMINPTDACLGPQLPRELKTFMDSGADILAIDYSWNWSRRAEIYSRLGAAETNSYSPSSLPTSMPGGMTPQDRYFDNVRECTEHVGARCVDSSIRMFCAIFLEQSEAHKQQLLKHFLAIIEKSQTASAAESLSSANIMTNIAAALLGIAFELVVQRKGWEDVKTAEAFLEIGQQLLSCASPEVRRAAGEALGLVAKMSDDAFTARLMNTIQTQMGSRAPITIAGAAFALGCAHRYLGALKTMRFFSFSVAALQSLARDFSDTFRVWILHAVGLLVDAAGSAFSTYLPSITAILASHALYDVADRSTLVTQALAKIIHAATGVLGPELADPSSTEATRLGYFWASFAADPHCDVKCESLQTLQKLLVFGAVEESAAMGVIVPALDYDVGACPHVLQAPHKQTCIYLS